MEVVYLNPSVPAELKQKLKFDGLKVLRKVAEQLSEESEQLCKKRRLCSYREKKTQKGCSNTPSSQSGAG